MFFGTQSSIAGLILSDLAHDCISTSPSDNLILSEMIEESVKSGWDSRFFLSVVLLVEWICLFRKAGDVAWSQLARIFLLHLRAILTLLDLAVFGLDFVFFACASAVGEVGENLLRGKVNLISHF